MTAPPRLAGFAVLLVGAAPLLAAQAPTDSQPVFRTGTTLVEVSAIVTDRHGRPVTDLTRDDVRVLDNGKEQPLVAFEYVDLTAVEGPAQRRDFVIVVDDLHIAPALSSQVRALCQSFEAALGPEDRVGLVTTGPHQIIEDLSVERSDVRRLLGALHGQAPTMRPEPLEREMRARNALGVLGDVARSLSGDASERRTILFVSEGHRVEPDGTGRLDDNYGARLALLDVVQQAALANAVIYTVDPRGLMAPGQLDGHANMAARYFGSLGLLAVETGGTLTVDTNDLAKDIPGIVRDSRQYYRLAYVQPDPAKGQSQPKTRRIEVKVSRPGVEVRARQAYAPRTTG